MPTEQDRIATENLTTMWNRALAAEEEVERLKFELARLHRAWDHVDAADELFAALEQGDLNIEEAVAAWGDVRGVVENAR